jgi:hypothetical protein
MAPADPQHPPLVPRARLGWVVGDELAEAPGARLPAPLAEELLEAAPAELAQRVGGEEQFLQLSDAHRRGAVDDGAGGGRAGDGVEDEDVVPVEPAPVGDDVRQSTSSARPVGDVGREGEVVEKAQVSRGGEVAEDRPGSAREDGGEVELPPRERGRVEAVDAGVDAVEDLPFDATAHPAPAEPGFTKLIEDDQLSLTPCPARDRGIDSSAIGG